MNLSHIWRKLSTIMCEIFTVCLWNKILPALRRSLARIFHIALETTTDRSADMLSAWDFRMPKAGCKPALRPRGVKYPSQG